MNKTAIENNIIFYRLIAVWVLCEAMLGGIIHGFKIPISGLFVGSCAVILITLIANYVNTKNAILKATIVVAVFKLLLSPQAPPTAYIALFFQGFLGEMLLKNKSFFSIKCYLLAIVCLVESGLQRIFVLTIIFGAKFWAAIDAFVSKLTNQTIVTTYSYYIAIGYLLLHIIAGIFIGWLCSILPKKLVQWQKQHGTITLKNMLVETQNIQEKKKRKNIALWVVWLILIVVYMQAGFGIGKPIIPQHIALQIFLRSCLIVVSWFLILKPIAQKILKNWLQKKHSEEMQTITNVQQTLPTMQLLIQQCWHYSNTKKGLHRIVYFIKILLVQVLYAG